MFRKNNFLILIVIACVPMLMSCNESVDNITSQKNLKDVNRVKINNINDKYTVLQSKKLSIEPELVFTKDNDNHKNRYTYAWYVRTDNVIGDIDTLSKKRNLNQAINVNPNDYHMYYEVKDSVTGITWQKEFTLNVRSLVYKGWMVLSGVNGNARLDMISLLDGKYKARYNVLSKLGSDLKLKGEPIDIYSYNQAQEPYKIYITTSGNGTTQIDANSFQWDPSMRISFQMNVQVPLKFTADFLKFVRAGFRAYVYKGGTVYKRPQNDLWGLAMGPVKPGQSSKVAPFIGSGFQADYFYLMKQKKFVQLPGRSRKYKELPEGDLFDWQTGMELLYMNDVYSGSFKVYAVLKDPDNSTIHLAIMDGLFLGQQIVWDDITDLPNIENANHFAVNPQFGYLFYSTTSGKLYEYNVNTKDTKLMLDESGGKKIVWMQFIRRGLSPDGDLKTLYNELTLATYDPSLPSDSSGTVKIFKVPSAQGQIKLINKFTGFGKIKDIDYRYRPGVN